VTALSDGAGALIQVLGGLQRADVEGDGQPFLLVGVDVLVAVAVINGADVDTPGAYVGIATGGDVAAALTVNEIFLSSAFLSLSIKIKESSSGDK